MGEGEATEAEHGTGSDVAAPARTGKFEKKLRFGSMLMRALAGRWTWTTIVWVIGPVVVAGPFFRSFAKFSRDFPA